MRRKMFLACLMLWLTVALVGPATAEERAAMSPEQLQKITLNMTWENVAKSYIQLWQLEVPTETHINAD